MNAPTKNLQTLLGEHLQAEIAVHRTLLGLAEAKQKHIVAADMAGLSAVLVQEQKPSEEAAFLRKQRDRLFVGIAERLSVPLANLKLAALIQRLPEQVRPELTEKQEELKQVLGKLNELNERNLLLIKHCLGVVNGVLKAVFVHTDEAVAGGYDKQGLEGGKPGRGRLVNLAG